MTAEQLCKEFLRAHRKDESFPHLRPHRIFNAYNSNACKTCDNVIFIVPFWLRFSCWEVSECQAYGSQSLRGHWLNHSFYYIITVPWSEYFWFTISTQYLKAPEKQLKNFNSQMSLKVKSCVGRYHIFSKYQKHLKPN